MRLRGLVMLLIVAMAVLLLPIAAYAITVYDISIPNAPLKSNLTTSNHIPFATVTVDLDNSKRNATIKIQILHFDEYCLVIDGAFGANINANSFSCTGLQYGSSTGLSSKANLVTYAGAGNEDGFGRFNATFKGPSYAGGAEAVDYISFVATNNDGTWADSDLVLTKSNKGYYAAAHIAVINNSGKTGYAGDSGPIGPPPAHAPVPPTVLLLGSGLVALAAWGGRLSKR